MKQKRNFIRFFAIIIAAAMLIMALGACKQEEQTVDIRVMSYNILHPDWTTAANSEVEDRIKLVRDIILDYTPDVIGLQETASVWHTALEIALCDSNTYKFACKLNKTEKPNMTTFLYNTKTLKLVDEYVIDIDEHSDIRVVSVAVFEKLSDGTRFVVTNTHPAPPGQAEDYKRHMTYITSVLKYELQKYKDLPLIMTGDFNTVEQSEYYENFMKDTGVKDAKYEAKTLVREYNTFSGFNKPPKEGNTSCLDHIFINDKATVELFDVIIDHDVQKASDHLPIYADIMLNTGDR